MESEKKIVGTCPKCGGNIIKTCKGYRCENNIGDNPSCSVVINGLGEPPGQRQKYVQDYR